MCGRYAMNDEVNELITEYVAAAGQWQVTYPVGREVTNARAADATDPQLLAPLAQSAEHLSGDSSSPVDQYQAD